VNRILIIGADTTSGNAVFHQLSNSNSVVALATATPRISGLMTAERITKSKLKTGLQATDVIVFCGAAAHSSWDADFGSFPPEERWLNQCVESALQYNSKFIFVSSDVVYAGPWIFHGDECTHFAKSRTAQELLRLEQCVYKVPNSLIIRTNVIEPASTVNSYCSLVLDALKWNRSLKLDATTSATPIAPDAFGKTFHGLLKNEISGYVNIGGAERTTAFRLALALAAGREENSSLFTPLVASRPEERSMRCDRMRSSSGVMPPLLSETIEALLHYENPENSAAAA
jgi:dTDP-4-dehydrorhamnose reductase